MIDKSQKNILWLSEIGIEDVPLVGGKNASLGEMYVNLTPRGVNLPEGFALTTNAYWQFLKVNKLDKALEGFFKEFNPQSVKSIQETGKKCREAILATEFPEELKKEILIAYEQLSKKYGANPDVAVRTSGVCEDMPNASFAGQFETYLNVRGGKELLLAVRKCIVSTFSDRAIAYREEKKIAQLEFALSVGVLKMIRSDLASSGIIFTLDTETGFPDVVLINSIWGIGELIVKGKITPDEFYVFKPTLKQGFKSIIVKNLGRKTIKYVYSSKGGLKESAVKKSEQLKFSINDEEILTLAKWAMIIEKHYSEKNGRWMPQDIEWAKDGKTGQLFIVQSRPETVHAPKTEKILEEYQIKTEKAPILLGIAIGEKIGAGKVRVIKDVSKIAQFKPGEVLVTNMTDPDWVPVMRIASAIITNEGGKTCHAAIVSRELGVPAIVGTQKATSVLKNNQIVTADCGQGMKGRVFLGKVPFEIKKHNLAEIPKTETKVAMNIGDPQSAFKSSFLPNSGVGLAREEFIIAEKIRVHPMALYNFGKIKDAKIKKKIQEITVEHKDKKEFFVKELAEGVAQIAAAFYPKEVIVRFSDFKTNEYRNLIGGSLFEEEEANPMMGFRGASRYISEKYQPAFLMECEAIKRVREVFGLKNVNVMVPFCRTVKEGQKAVEIIKSAGLSKEANNIKIYVMCEIPANVVLAEDFLEIFDGFSIGSNDLTQLVLGLDRDNAAIAYIGDERNEAVKELLRKTIKICKEKGKYIGICGEAASMPDFAKFLVDCEIESLSVNPHSIIKTILTVADAEKERKLQKN
ncbi:phosphoenolpyruvate synthase [Patescibacteria group bacterium]|nr:phosphoenolpyruvate synthase [Patescibacteria group bacterium]